MLGHSWRRIWWLSVLASQGLCAQEDAAAARGPIRFDSLPVAAAAPLDVGLATQAAIAALLALQEGDDADQWPYEGVYREDGGQLPVGYRVGGTAIACLGLVAAPGYRDDSRRREAVDRGLAFVLAALDAPRMQPGFIGTYDVRGWGHVYALQLLLHLQDQGLVPASQQAEVERRAASLVATLVGSAIPKAGGWNYSRPRGYRSPRNSASTFMTAPALQALFQAKARGHDVPEQVVTEALDALERSRARSGGHAYQAPKDSRARADESALAMIDRTPGSAARAAACETTLLLAGRGDPTRLARAVDLFFDHWDDLAVRKSQPGTHIEPYGIAPYYFLFGHVYVAQAIEQLADAGLRQRYRERLRALLALSREPDGSWNDRHFARSAGYGTAMALLALHMPELPRPPRWLTAPAAK
jgi:hypothetical protein